LPTGKSLYSFISAISENLKGFFTEAITTPIFVCEDELDIDVSMSTPSTSSINVMKLIDKANHAATVPDSEQWTIR
jgi:hypothetical protein